MKVLIIGQFGIERFASHISQNLDDMGHQTCNLEVSPLSNNSQKFLQRLNYIYENLEYSQRFFAKRLSAAIERFSPDMIISTYDYLTPSHVKNIKNQTSAPIVLWYPDSIAGFSKSYFMNADYDFIFFKDPFIVMRFKDILSSRVYYMPECFNPIVHKQENKFDIKKYCCDITTAGNLHPYRIQFFKNLLDLGLDIKIWGFPPAKWSKWKTIQPLFQNKPVFDSEKVFAFQSSKIVLNNLLYSEVYGLNVRAFEIAGSKAFQLIDYREGLRDLFQEGKEIISFSGLEDLKDKIKFYLNEPGLRKKISEAAYEAAISKHTYKHRLELIESTVFGNSHGYPSHILERKC